VVTHAIPPGEFAAGVPARVVRERRPRLVEVHLGGLSDL